MGAPALSVLCSGTFMDAMVWLRSLIAVHLRRSAIRSHTEREGAILTTSLGRRQDLLALFGLADRSASASRDPDLRLHVSYACRNRKGFDLRHNSHYFAAEDVVEVDYTDGMLVGVENG